jgi:hypothetical protein
MARKSKPSAEKSARRKPNAKAETVKPEAETPEGAIGAKNGWPENHEEQVKNILQLYRTTRNPILVWTAFGMILETQRYRDPKSETVKLPPELLGYFGRLTVVIAGWFEACSDGRMTPDAALKKVIDATGFKRKGKNAFDDARRLTQTVQLLDLFDDLRANGASRRDAMTAVLNAAGVESERAIERRFATYKKMQGDDKA